MKILKFSGIVAGVHLLALILIFANPGCSSSTKPARASSDPVAKSDATPTITVPGGSSSSYDGGAAPAAAPISFNPDSSVRYSPTRPGTPAASTLQVEPVGNVTPATTYVIVSGDNLSVIAKKNHTTVSEIAAANNLNPNTAKLFPGKKLIIPAKVAAPVRASEPITGTTQAIAAPESSSTKLGADGVKHTVKSGETLSAIAKRYGVKQGEIAVANNISDPQKIRPGMVLTIPGWKSTDGKMARSPKTPAADTSAPRDYNSTTPASTGLEPTPEAAAHPATAEVPVIQVDEAPAPAK